MPESLRRLDDTLSVIDHAPAYPVRVLVVAPSLDILGGQAVQAASLMRQLRAERSVDIAFLPINPRLPGVLRILQSIKYLRTCVTSLWYIATLMARVPQYDVIHIFSASYFSFVLAPTPALLLAKCFGRKTILNYHSGEAAEHLAQWPSARWVIGLSDAIVVPSDYLVRVFQQFALSARAIRNTIEVEAFPFRERAQLRPLFLSNRNLEVHYGVDCVLHAFARIQTALPDAKLTVVGDGSERRSLEQLALDLRLRHVEFTGAVDHDEVFALYDVSDILLNGALIDNQPLSVLEAFSCGVLVVTTNAGGLPDLVEHNRTGLMVPCGDAESIAEQAMYLLDHPGVARSISHQARDECHAYTWPAVRHEWLALYGALAEGRRGGRSSRQDAQTRAEPTAFDHATRNVIQRAAARLTSRPSYVRPRGAQPGRDD